MEVTSIDNCACGERQAPMAAMMMHATTSAVCQRRSIMAMVESVAITSSNAGQPNQTPANAAKPRAIPLVTAAHRDEIPDGIDGRSRYPVHLRQVINSLKRPISFAVGDDATGRDLADSR